MLVLLFACAGASPDSASGPPALTLLAPADGDVVCGDPLRISTRVENFTLTEEVATDDPALDKGHIHLYLNGQEAATSYTPDFEVPDIVEGEKQLRVELGLTNHEALDPYVGTTIYVTVDNTVCGG